jgi:hypothetical protein
MNIRSRGSSRRPPLGRSLGGRALGLFLAGASLALPACKDDGVALSPPRDSGSTRPRETGAPFVIPDAPAPPDGAHQCHAVRFSLEGDGSAACVMRFREPITHAYDVQILVSTDGSNPFLGRSTLNTCNAHSWYWLEEPPNGAVLALCDETCRSLRNAGVAYIDVRVRCPAPLPMK